jgi:hypothetical protein
MQTYQEQSESIVYVSNPEPARAGVIDLIPLVPVQKRLVTPETCSNLIDRKYSLKIPKGLILKTSC